MPLHMHCVLSSTGYALVVLPRGCFVAQLNSWQSNALHESERALTDLPSCGRQSDAGPPVASCQLQQCGYVPHTPTHTHTVSLCDCFGLAEDRRQVAACIVFVSVVACRMPQAARRTPHLPNPPLSPPASDKLIGHFGPKGKRLQQSQQN